MWDRLQNKRWRTIQNRSYFRFKKANDCKIDPNNPVFKHIFSASRGSQPDSLTGLTPATPAAKVSVRFVWRNDKQCLRETHFRLIGIRYIKTLLASWKMQSAIAQIERVSKRECFNRLHRLSTYPSITELRINELWLGSVLIARALLVYWERSQAQLDHQHSKRGHPKSKGWSERSMSYLG